MTPDDWADSGIGHWVIERIDEYLDGELPSEERLEFERCMAEDPAVAAEVLEAKRFRALAAEAGPLPIPDELGERIRERVAAGRSTGGGRILLLRRVLTVAVAAAVIFLVASPLHMFDPDPAPEPVRPMVVRLGNPGTPSPRSTAERLEDWLDQAKNLNPADADLSLREARELGLLAEVRSRLADAPGSDRNYLQAAEDLLIQVENGISPEALPMEAQMVAMARN